MIETSPGAYGRGFPEGTRSYPEKASQVQPHSVVKSFTDQSRLGRKRSVRARRAETSKSASELVAYWESLSESPEGLERNINISAIKEHNPILRGPSQQSAIIEPRRATTSGVIANPRDNHHLGQVPSAARKLDFKTTASFFRDLIKPHETYQTKLTERPQGKDSLGSSATAAQVGSDRPRILIGKSEMSASIDSKFKRTVDNMEQLLGEAVVLANQAADRSQEPSVAVAGRDSLVPPSNIHESLPSIYDESSEDEADPQNHKKQPNSVPATVKMVAMQSAAASVHNSTPHHLPKHVRSAPGMHSRNVNIDIPKRTTSLRKAKTITERRSYRGMKEPPLRPLKDRFQELSPPISPFTQSPRPKSPATTRSMALNANRELSADDSESGCLLLSKSLKKSRSCLSCRSWIPLLNTRFSFSQRSTRQEEAQAGVVSLDGVDITHTAAEGGGLKQSASWSFDGACDYNGLAEDEDEDELLRISVQTDGVGASEEMSQFPMPPDHQQDFGPDNGTRRINLRGKAHVSLRGYQGFNLARAYRRHPVARDWSTVRKRFAATVACLSTAAVGTLIGVYAGLVPSIQYWIADLEHYAILGNVFFYVGLAIPTFFCWPLPLLHRRKPYILSSLVLAMPLLFPQAIAVSSQRSPYVSTWRWALLSSRAFMGLTLGFASMNFHAILMDLFGASLMSGNPHQEIVDKHDVRRHGGGMGAWLGLWTWCFVGSLGVGFLIGAAIIDTANPSWGFYVSIVLIMFILLLNVICPEVRRSPFRRSVAEVRNGNRISRRVARGEVMMHRVKDGPTWWGQEVLHGILLSLEMARQPGFLVMALYTGWIYAQVVLIIVLLGALASRSYLLRSPLVGLCVVFVSIGVLVAVPFQKANILSRGRHHQQQSNEDTFDKKFSWTSHLLRRTIFCLVLPLVGIAYTFASAGPPIPLEVPTFLAALIGILSGLAISECNGLMMETFDTSDLQPGMTGRPRANTKSSKRTNYSSFPRVTAGFAICHTIGYILAAVATAVGGSAQRNLGQQAATGVVAGILMILTLLLLAVLIRFKDVQIIPASKTVEMEKWEKFRRESIRRRSLEPRQQPQQQQNTMTDEEIWRPLLMGNPSSKMRRVNILELGSMTRWTEIRKKNKLIDETAAHLNRAALESAATAIEETTTDLVRRVSSRRSARSPRPGSPPATGPGGIMRRFHSGSPGPVVMRSDSPIPRTGSPVTISTVPAPLAMELDSFVVDRRDYPPQSSSAPPTATAAHQQQQSAGDSTYFKTRTTPGVGIVSEDYFMERECVLGQTVKEEDEVGEMDESDFLSSSDMDGDVHHPQDGNFRDAVHSAHLHHTGGAELGGAQQNRARQE
ncbi:hypothetical protein QBC42DRAFT_328321 [Cladorrhinum samala]|uniref:Polyamine transport protein n=1 Tax=Cladorrhinum samala TaxID=585594 RepID=A0AAV9HSP4_9PEZI|nr:hypothetical protein QBC42DRAFT_328321 [Cladorrhinum samala]